MHSAKQTKSKSDSKQSRGYFTHGDKAAFVSSCFLTPDSNKFQKEKCDRLNLMMLE